MAGMRMPRRGGPMVPMGKMQKGVLKRLMKMLFSDYKLMLVVMGITIVLINLIQLHLIIIYKPHKA